MRGLKSWVKGGSTQGKSGYKLKFDYDVDIIQRLKSTIPGHMREWDDDKKEWWVSEYFEKQINDVFPGFLEAVVAQKRLF